MKGLAYQSLSWNNSFERCFRASTSVGIAVTVIGLHLVQHFIGLHSGKVEVESEVGVGTTFLVRLPLVDPANGGAVRAA